jgi:hypothetical protein
VNLQRQRDATPVPATVPDCAESELQNRPPRVLVHRCHSTDVLQPVGAVVGARFADSGLRGFLTAVGHGVTATECHAPSTTDQSARGIWGESASAWSRPEAPGTGLSFNRRPTDRHLVVSAIRHTMSAAIRHLVVSRHGSAPAGLPAPHRRTDGQGEEPNCPPIESAGRARCAVESTSLSGPVVGSWSISGSKLNVATALTNQSVD